MKKFRTPTYNTLSYKVELIRQKFWYWVMTKHPKAYKFFEKNTKLDTLSF